MKNSNLGIIDSTNIDSKMPPAQTYKAIICLGENSGVLISGSIQWLSSTLH